MKMAKKTVAPLSKSSNTCETRRHTCVDRDIDNTLRTQYDMYACMGTDTKYTYMYTVYVLRYSLAVSWLAHSEEPTSVAVMSCSRVLSSSALIDNGPFHMYTCIYMYMYRIYSIRRRGVYSL